MTTWVDPRTLSLIIPEGEGSTGEGTSEIMTSPRKSPRTIERQTGPRSAPRAAELPELAAHERDRKLPMKKPLAQKEVQRRGRQKEACQTKESNVPIEKRIEEFPGHSLAKDPQTVAQLRGVRARLRAAQPLSVGLQPVEPPLMKAQPLLCLQRSS